MKQDILTRTKKRKVETLLQEGRLAEAKELCEQVFEVSRADPEVLVLLGTIYRRLGNHAEAESLCRQALRLAPKLAEAHQALGAVLHSQGRMQEAMDCYQTAIRLKPTLIEPHYLMGNALRETGLHQQAISHYRAVLRLNPEHVPTLCNLGGTLVGLQQLEEAAMHLNKANQLRPGTAPILCSIARFLMTTKKSVEAEAYCREALQYDSNAVDAIGMLAEILEQSSRLDETREMVDRGLRLAPGHVGLSLISAKLARRDKRYPEAVAIAEAALTTNPDADLMASLHHLLGQLYDRLNNTDRAFRHFSEGNRISMTIGSGPEKNDDSYLHHIAQRHEQIRAVRPDAIETATNEADLGEGSPVFLVGFPRSGTTLLEQILDSHPQLQALDERPTVSVMRKTEETIVARRGEAANTFTGDEIKELRDSYFKEADKHLRREPGKILVDKNPLNMVEAYLIWRVFPEAKFILAIRHPCDVCLSCFMQHFALNKAMTTFTTLENTAAAYAGVMDLWRKYTQFLPIKFHMIRYEDLVENMEEETRRLLNFLEIEWDDAVLGHVAHAKGRGAISTPSYHQVTQPIYKSAKYRWKRYAKEIEPIVETLRPYIEYFGYGETS